MRMYAEIVYVMMKRALRTPESPTRPFQGTRKATQHLVTLCGIMAGCSEPIDVDEQGDDCPESGLVSFNLKSVPSLMPSRKYDI